MDDEKHEPGEDLPPAVSAMTRVDTSCAPRGAERRCRCCGGDDRRQVRARPPDRLGRGGMGAVYEAADLRLDRGVAVKRMSAGLLATMRRSTIRAGGPCRRQVNHPNIITWYDYGAIGADGAHGHGAAPGVTLRAKMMHGAGRPSSRLPPTGVRADARRHSTPAHEQQWVHRD